MCVIRTTRKTQSENYDQEQRICRNEAVKAGGEIFAPLVGSKRIPDAMHTRWGTVPPAWAWIRKYRASYQRLVRSMLGAGVSYTTHT